MNEYYEAPELVHHSTSYFGPLHGLDPRLFLDGKVRPWVADDIEMLIFNFLQKLNLQGIEGWLHVWLAGSGVSFQWAGVDPSDLDCLIGVDWVVFRRYNDDYTGLSDSEIASWLNEKLYQNLRSNHWHGFELTFYINPHATDILAIKPYAAWDITCGCWTVPPNPSPSVPSVPAWTSQAENDRERTLQILERFQQFSTTVRNAINPAARTNAEVYLRAALRQGADLYNEIHEARGAAFSMAGEGYASEENFRWQSAKASGVKDVLSKLKQYNDSIEADKFTSYGVEMPSVDTLITRAALSGRRIT